MFRVKLRSPKSTANSILLAHEIGLLIERLAEEQGLLVDLPVEADWGYAFRVRIRKRKLDVLIEEDRSDEYCKVKVRSTLDKLDKLLRKKDDIEIMELNNILGIILQQNRNVFIYAQM
jgi:hypothetical protein